MVLFLWDMSELIYHCLKKPANSDCPLAPTCSGSAALMRSTTSGNSIISFSDTTFPTALTPLSVLAARCQPTCIRQCLGI